MNNPWEKIISGAQNCAHCKKALTFDDKRILSAYDHTPICLECKGAEEKRPDYEETMKQVVGQCMAETEILYSDPGGYCFYHFYPYTCSKQKDSIT